MKEKAVKTKRCRECKEEKDITTFQKQCISKDGYSTICKSCGARKEREKRINNIEEYRARAKLRKKIPKKRKKMYERLKKYNKKFPERTLARQRLKDHIKAGKIIKPSLCCVCNKERPLDGHHNDYNKPLEVVWLCKPCHSKFHCGITKRAYEIREIVMNSY